MWTLYSKQCLTECQKLLPVSFHLIFFLMVTFFPLCAGKLLLNLMDHTDIVRDLTFAPDGSLVLVSASRDKTLRVWDLKDDGEKTSC